MPTERPIIPKGMPNPIGPAVFKGIRNVRRIGGDLPIDKYPLVSKAANGFSTSTKLVSTKEACSILKHYSNIYWVCFIFYHVEH